MAHRRCTEPPPRGDLSFLLLEKDLEHVGCCFFFFLISILMDVLLPSIQKKTEITQR